MSPPSERVRGTPAVIPVRVRPLLSSSVFYCRVHPPSTADGAPPAAPWNERMETPARAYQILRNETP